MRRGCIEAKRNDPYHDWDWDNDGFPGEYVYGDDCYVDECYMGELWKRIPGFDDYWVSDAGRIYSAHSDSFLKGSPVGSCGHLDVCLWRNGRRYHRYVHRLVAEAFIPNPHNLPVVRHLDNDPTYNDIENLEWGTCLDNVRDCIDAGRFKYFTEESRELAMQKRRTPVTAVDLRTGEEIDYISQQEAARDLGMSQSSINRVLCGRANSAGRYYFYYTNKPKKIDVSTHVYSRHNALIRAIDLHTGKRYVFRGQTEAAKELGMSVSSVSLILSGKLGQAKGFTFEYVEEDYDD